MLYQITDGTVSAGGETILSHIDFEIKGNEKLAIVGRNGAGKTTLLRLIAGELELDRDDRRNSPGIKSSRKLTVGMLKQNSSENMDKRIRDMILEGCASEDPYSRERYLYEMEFDRIFTGFGFNKADKDRVFSTFSGGEQTRIAMIRLLLEKPDILLLDEPTNHLDLAAVEWLEGYMREYEKAAVFVSHDRFFLDKVADAVYELEDRRLTRYAGNYTAYRKEKDRLRRSQLKAWERQQAEEKRLQELVDKFKNKPKKAAFARSRKTLMARMEHLEKPGEEEIHIFTDPIEPLVFGPKWVVEAEHLKIGYDKALLELSLRIRRGQKIGILGDNGAGKTTFLKTLIGQLPPLEGELTIGNNTVMGYFDQQTALMTSEASVVEHFTGLFPGMTDKEARQTLGAWLFPGREAAKKVSALSGGERSRLYLCELLTERPNLLIMDEPTNHMDIPAMETLESALKAYTGTLLFVSHDRYFVEKTADAILVMEADGVYYYPFGYEHYLRHCRDSREPDLSARITAENQALVADMRAVPKGERHRLREIGTEEAFVDWKLKLAAQPLAEAEERYEGLWRQYQEQLCPEEIETELQAAWEDWHRECLNWYELFCQLDL